MIRINSRSGLTLIDTLLYSVIFATMMSFVIITLYQTVDSRKGSEGRLEVETEADFVMKKFQWMLAGGTVIEPISGASTTRLSVNKFNEPMNPLTVELSDGAILMSKGGGFPVVLNSSNVSANELLFHHFSASGNRPAGVQISLSLVASTTANIVKASTSYQTTIYLRQ